jgi:hypothetical protein
VKNTWQEIRSVRVRPGAAFDRDTIVGWLKNSAFSIREVLSDLDDAFRNPWSLRSEL